MPKKTYPVDIRPRGRNGPRFRKKFDTQAEANAYTRHIMAKHADAKPWEDAKPDPRTLSDLIELWHQLHGQSLKSGDQRRTNLLYLADAMGNPRAQSITAKTFADFRARRLKTVSANTANHDLTFLKSLFNELERLGEWQHGNPFAKIRRIKIDERELTYLEEDEITLLLDKLDSYEGSDAGIIARVCLATGARWGEAATLKKSQVRKGKIQFTGTKSGKNRSVPISEKLEELLLEELPLTDGYSTFKRAMRDIDLELPKGQLSHVLRHTFASHFMLNGGNIIALQRILGHGSLAMTMRYAHLSPEHLQEAVSLNPLASTL